MHFLKAYIKSMRIYYAFVTGIAGWVGVAYYEYTIKNSYAEVQGESIIFKKILLLSLLFLSWGINQIINDYLGLKEDRINAPNRPMVTGELDPKKAIIFSFILLSISMILIALFLEPIAIIPALLAVILNIIYEYAKGYGILGNIIFGIMIAMCSVVGYMAIGPMGSSQITSDAAGLLIMIVVMNGLMTFYTFFKDYKGDLAANKKTLVVKYGVEKSRKIALVSAVIPGVIFAFVYYFGLISLDLNNIFLFLAALTLFLYIWTGVLYYKYPYGERTYYSLSVNFKACACGQSSLIALMNPTLGMMLFILTYIFVGFLFDLYSDSKG